MRPDDPELAQLLKQFVPVRITNFKGVDLNRFRFDYDLTFAVLFMDAGGGTYARFGSQDFTTSTSRMSIAGLKNAMRGVLALHKTDPAAAVPPPDAKPQTISDIPAWSTLPMAKSECYHCHFAQNARIAQLRLDDKFTKDQLFLYPLPESIGVALDVDRNNVVRSVIPGSAAEKAGLRAGDAIEEVGAARIFSAADLQFALNDVPDPGSVRLQVKRHNRDRQEAVAFTLALPKGWRRTDISWRPSQGSIPPIIGIWEEPLKPDDRRKLALTPDALALRVSFLFPGAKWAPTRGNLKMNDVIVGIDGKSLPNMTARQFHSYFRLNFNVGEKATLNVLRAGQKLDVQVPCLDVGEG